MRKDSRPFEKKAVGDRLDLIREDKRMIQQDFADAIGVSVKAIQNYTYGYRDISAVAIHGLIGTFGVNIRWLLTGEGSMYTGTQHDIIERLHLLTPAQQLEIKAAMEEKQRLNQLSEQVAALQAKIDAID